MANFDQAILVLFKLEGDGKISHDPKDPGGVTKWGISKRYNPELDIENLSSDDAIAYYRKNWWDPAYDRIKSQDIANKVFTLAVNMGKRPAHICLQRALRAASGTIIPLDGSLGSVTLASINSCTWQVLLASLKSEAACYYKSLNSPEEAGLLNRAYA